MSGGTVSGSRLLGKNGVSAGINSSRAPRSFRLSRRLAARPASTSARPCDLAWCTWYSPAATRRLAAKVSRNSRPRHAGRSPGISRTAARSTDLLRVTAISVRGVLGFDLVQPGIDAFQAEPHADQVDDRLAPRRDALIQLFGALIIIGGGLDVVLLRRKTADVTGIPPGAVGAIAIAIGEQQFLAIAQCVAALLRLLQGLVALGDILQAVDVDARQAEFGIRGFRQELLRLIEFFHGEIQFLRAAVAGAVDTRQMAFAQAEPAAGALLGVHRQRPRRHGARAFPLLLVDQLRFVVAVGIDHVVGRFDKLLLHHFPWSVQKERRRIALGKLRPSGPNLVEVGKLFGLNLARQLLAVLIEQVVRGQDPPAIQDAGEQQKQQDPHGDAEGAGFPWRGCRGLPHGVRACGGARRPPRRLRRIAPAPYRSAARLPPRPPLTPPPARPPSPPS